MLNKEAISLVAFIFNQPLNYNNKGSNDYIVAVYPAKYLGKASAIGQTPTASISYDPKIPITLGSTNTYENYASMLSQMDAESVAEYSEGLSNMLTELTDMASDLVTFWSEADNDKSRILTLTDDEIIAEVHETGKTESGSSWEQYIIPAYNNENLKKTHWSGWCGPAATSWVYRGLYKNYPLSSNNKIRIRGDGSWHSFHDSEIGNDRAYYGYNHGESASDVFNESNNTDFGLFSTLATHCIPLGEHPMTPSGVDNAMKAVTNKNYKVSLTLSPHNKIINNSLPIFSLIIYSKELHWLAAFGTATSKTTSGKVIKITKTIKYLLVTDNGTVTAGNSFYPYWRSQTGLCYAVHR